MNSALRNAFIFVSGMAAGAAAAWMAAKRKYERIAQEEIDSVKAAFSKRKAEKDAEDAGNGESGGEEAAVERHGKERTAYQTMLERCGYAQKETPDGRKEETGMERPYVIAPEEFGEFEEYERISLTYYSDQVLADEDDELVEDADEVVGLGSLSHFGEYEDDSVFVRNDRLKCDYEILLDHRKYSEVYKARARSARTEG